MHNLNELISDDIQLFSLSSDQAGIGPWLHKHTQLKISIDKWRKIFQTYPTNKNPTIGIILNINFEYFAVIYAAMSLGYNFVILDAKFDDSSSHKEFLPLDFMVYDGLMELTCDDISYWKSNAKYLIDAREVPWTKFDQQIDQITLPNIDFNLTQFNILSSTTSGTTSSPKKILHSYKYFVDIAKRNAKVLNFKGRSAHIKNLHHGSAMPVFFMPSAIASNFHLCLTWVQDADKSQQDGLYDILRWTEYLDINHFIFPYSQMLTDFLKMVHNKNMYYTDLKLYTLYYIDPALKKYIKNKNIEIISIFGCTETSGPIMINSLSNANADTFDPTVFYTLDDFFNIEILPDGTRIKSKNGLVDHIMYDRFEKIDKTQYRHMGRSDLYRINDIIIDPLKLETLLKSQNINGQIIIDMPKQTLYLAVWDQGDCKRIQNIINQELKNMFNNKLVTVSKSDNLNKFEFIAGIKLNQEFVRNYFRSMENKNEI